MQKGLQKSQSEHDALQSNVSLLVDVWARIGSTSSILRFHGVTEDDLKAVDITADELAYLIASFEAAGYYYERIDKGTGPFRSDSLRYRMCASEATRKAWPLLKRFFLGSPAYLARIEKTIGCLSENGVTRTTLAVKGEDMDTEKEYSETLLSFRHYSNLRFAIFSVFIAITAGLIAALYGKDALSGPKELSLALRIFGLIMALSFWWIEITLDGYVTAFAKKAVDLNPQSHLNDRPAMGIKFVPFATMSIHIAATVFWVLSFYWDKGDQFASARDPREPIPAVRCSGLCGVDAEPVTPTDPPEA